MELPEDLQAIAEAELGETAERRSEAVTQLKQLLSDTSHQQAAIQQLFAAIAETGITQEELLLQHLRARKFDVGKAYKSLSLRAAFLHEHPDLASNMTGEEFLEVYESGLMRVLPGTDKLGRRIICLRPAHLQEMGVDPMFIRWQVWCMSRLARDPVFQVHGVVLVMNFDSIKLADAKHMAGQLRHGRMRLMVHYIKECAPTRIGGIYFMNQPKFISIVWSIVNLFLGKKIRSRFMGSNLAALHELIKPQNLPPLLGGTLQQANPLEWLQQQIEQQNAEASAAAAARAKHAAAAAAVSSWTIDESNVDEGSAEGTTSSNSTEPVLAAGSLLN